MKTENLQFLDSDSPVQRTVITAFMESYTTYYRATVQFDLRQLLSDFGVQAQALRDIGECDESHRQRFETMLEELFEKVVEVGRFAGMTCEFMKSKRSGEPVNTDELAETWPDVVNENEM